MADVKMRREVVEFDENDIRKRRDEFMELCWTIKYKIGKIRIHLNPISTLFGACAFWLVIGWALADSETSIEKFGIAKQWLTGKCTWFYISSQFVWVILIFVIYFKFGHIRLGLENDRPEYGNFDYFAMIFTTGICNGLFYDSANAPIVGYKNTTDNLLQYRGKSNRISQAQNSLNVVMYHWGFHGFSVYVLPCLLVSVLCYRKGLPLTMRSCLYPVFGRKIFGRLGDLVDSVSIICMGFGVSTSFLLGTIMLVVGIKSLFPEVAVDKTSELIALWSVCGMSIFSASSGIKLGIRRMSQLCFLTGALFTITVALSDDVWYLLNLSVQSIGHYFQYLIATSSYTSAFLQQGNYPGSTKEEVEWMHNNTVFYWGWWLGWAPLVAIFATRISKGRTIKNIIEMAFIVPSFVNFIWFIVIGGLAIDMENQALSKQLTCNMTIRPADTPQWLQRLECAEENNRFFFILDKYEDIKTFLLLIALLITLLYFITSFDSAALVLGTISSNGEENPPFIQRVFWCLSMGACTSVLIIYEEEVGRSEINVFVILAGLPFAFLMCFCAAALWRLLKQEPYWSYDRLIKWKMLYGNINSLRLLKVFLSALICPSYWLGKIAIKHKNLQNRGKIITTYFLYTFLFYMWLLLLLLRIKYEYVNNIGWALFIGFIVLAGRLRTNLRRYYEINGNVLEDVALMVIYPLTVIQMLEQVESAELGPRARSTKLSNGWKNRFPSSSLENGFTPGGRGGLDNDGFRTQHEAFGNVFHMGAVDDLGGGEFKEDDLVEA